MGERLLLLDSASMYFRAFHGLPESMTAPNGAPVNAVRGFFDAIARLVTELGSTHVVACWDDDWRPQWRVDLIESYKAHRVGDSTANAEEVPDTLSPQVSVIVQGLALAGIARVGVADHEADDVIGTLATTATMPVDVVTGDRDLFQLIDDERDVRVIYTGKGMSKLDIVTDEVLCARYGVAARHYAAYAALRGDASDGLPGVAGVGEKTAAQLVAAYGSVPNVVAAAHDLAAALTPRVRANILVSQEYLAVAPKVVEVVRDLPMPADLATRLPAAPPDPDALAAWTTTWGLSSPMKRLATSLRW